jgi:uncharacterized membrane-anchored protein
VNPRSEGSGLLRRLPLTFLALPAMLLALLWPALYNGEPFYFPDTTAYVRGADAAFHRFTGVITPWSSEQPTTGADTAGPAAEGLSSVKNKTVLAGRSVYYGLLLYVGDRIGGFWTTTICQSLLLLLAMALFFRAMDIPPRAQLVLTVIALSLVSSLAFYASFLMPDIFSGVVVLGCASLIGADPKSLQLWEYALWFGLLALGLMFHDSHLLIAATLLAVAVVRNLLRRNWDNWRGLAVIVVCLAIAAVAAAVFGWAVSRMLGAPAVRPPFLMARLIEDGPGTQYLNETCPQSGFQACDFRDRLPMDAEDFIWGVRRPGVFSNASPEVRRRLSAEQYRFVFSVFERYPAAVMGDVLFDAGKQLILVKVVEFNQSGPDARSLENKLPPEYRTQFQRSAAYRGSMPTNAYSILNSACFALSAVSLVVMLGVPRMRRLLDPKHLTAILLVIAGVIVNAAVCGALSGPHDRYEARLSWLLPFVAIAVGLELAARRRRLPTAEQAVRA